MQPVNRVTRDIDPAGAAGLLERVPRPYSAYATEQGPLVLLVVLVTHDRRYWVGIIQPASHKPDPGQEVVLLVDEGVHDYDRRAIYIRSQAQPAEAPVSAPTRHAWLEVVPLKTVAWDYGSIGDRISRLTPTPKGWGVSFERLSVAY